MLSIPAMKIPKEEKVRRSIAVTILALGLTFSGCASMKSGTLTHKVTASQHSFKDFVKGFQDAEIAEHDKGAVPEDYHVSIQQGIAKVATAAVDLDTYLAGNATAAGIKAKLDNLYSLLDSIQSQGLVGVKNANSKALLEIALDQAKAIVDTALTQVAQ